MNNSELADEALSIQDQTTASLQRTLRTVNETEDLGMATAEEVVRQGKQIDRMQNKMHELDANLNRADKVRVTCCLLYCLFAQSHSFTHSFHSINTN